MKMKWLKRLGVSLLVLYILFCVGMYFLQERFIFFPDKLSESYVFNTGEEVEIEVANDIFLNCLWMKEPQSNGVILYLHGNKGTNRRCFRQSQSMADNQYDIFMPDYRGYGKSDGKIYSESQILEDAQKVYDFLLKHYEEKNIIVVGYSLGSGMASYLAANNKPQQLVMLAPYLSLTYMKNRIVPFVPDFLLKYPLESEQYIQTVKCPITLFHGTADELIPFNSSEELKKIRPDLELVKLQGVSHRGVIFDGGFKRKFRLLTKG